MDTIIEILKLFLFPTHEPNIDFAWLNVVGGAIAGLGSIFGGSISANASRKNTRETNALNRELYFDQKDYNTQMMHYNNWYNSPSQQVSRLVEAGLNPQNMLGSINTGSGTSATAPTAPNMISADESALGQGIANAMPIMANALHTLNAGNKIKAETNGINLENAFQALTLGDRVKGIQLSNDSIQSSIDNMRQQTQLMQAQTALVGFQAQEKEIMNKYLDQNQQIQLVTNMQELYLLRQKGYLNDAQYDLMQQQIISAQLGNEIQSTELEYLTKTLNARIQYAHLTNKLSELGWEIQNEEHQANRLGYKIDGKWKSGYQWRVQNELFKTFGEADEATNWELKNIGGIGTQQLGSTTLFGRWLSRDQRNNGYSGHYIDKFGNGDTNSNLTPSEQYLRNWCTFKYNYD